MGGGRWTNTRGWTKWGHLAQAAYTALLFGACPEGTSYNQHTTCFRFGKKLIRSACALKSTLCLCVQPKHWQIFKNISAENIRILDNENVDILDILESPSALHVSPETLKCRIAILKERNIPVSVAALNIFRGRSDVEGVHVCSLKFRNYEHKIRGKLQHLILVLTRTSRSLLVTTWLHKLVVLFVPTFQPGSRVTVTTWWRNLIWRKRLLFDI